MTSLNAPKHIISRRGWLNRLEPSTLPNIGQSKRHRQIHKQHLARRLASRVVHAAASSSSGNGKGPVIVVDNYDSFTYNLCQYLGDLGCEHIVVKNDEKTVEELRAMQPRGILISPGPGRPEDSGISLAVVRELGPAGVPIFGVCMGHQCIGQAFGGRIVRAPCGVMHGKSSLVYHIDKGVCQYMESPFKAARYHSLVIDWETCPHELEITAWSEEDDGELTIMAVQHRHLPHIEGVQFHPESIITDDGKDIVARFVRGL